MSCLIKYQLLVFFPILFTSTHFLQHYLSHAFIVLPRAHVSTQSWNELSSLGLYIAQDDIDHILVILHSFSMFQCTFTYQYPFIIIMTYSSFRRCISIHLSCIPDHVFISITCICYHSHFNFTNAYLIKTITGGYTMTVISLSFPTPCLLSILAMHSSPCQKLRLRTRIKLMPPSFHPCF